jgi:hypothetical protein
VDFELFAILSWFLSIFQFLSDRVFSFIQAESPALVNADLVPKLSYDADPGYFLKFLFVENKFLLILPEYNMLLLFQWDIFNQSSQRVLKGR